MSSTFLITFPTIRGPVQASWKLIRYRGGFQSPLNGYYQGAAYGGDAWAANLSFKLPYKSDGRLLSSFLLEAGEEGARFYLPNPIYARQGSAAGTPVVDGAGQTGKVLNIRGLTLSAAGIYLIGDMLQLATGQLVQTTKADVNADGAGKAAVNIQPALRSSPADGSAIISDAPTAKFRILVPSDGLENAFSPPQFGAFSFSIIEDIYT